MDIEFQNGEPKTLDMDAGANKSAPGLTIEKSQRQANHSMPIQPAPRPPVQRPLPPLQEHARAPKVSDVDAALEDFANPQHVRAPQDVLDDTDNSVDGLSDFDNDSRGGDDDRTVSEYAPEIMPDDDQLRPSPGYNTLDEEASALLFKIHRAKKVGMPVPSLTMSSDIRELRSTVSRVTEEISLDSSIKFQRKMVCLLSSSLEWMSNKYSPFGEDLDGWSESVASGITDYDQIFTELFYKYRGSMSVGPEVRLIFALAGSMFWFNLTKTLTKRMTSPSASGGLDISSMLGAMMGGGGGTPPQQSKPVGAPPATTAPPPSANAGVSRPPSEFTRRPMKGPGSTIGSLFQQGPSSAAQAGGEAPPIAEQSLFPGGPPPVFEPADLPVMSAPVAGRKRARDSDSDGRLSDVVSDDSDTSIDDSSSDPETTDSESIRVSTVPVGGRGRGRGRGRGGGRGGGRGATKTVISL